MGVLVEYTGCLIELKIGKINVLNGKTKFICLKLTCKILRELKISKLLDRFKKFFHLYEAGEYFLIKSQSTL